MSKRSVFFWHGPNPWIKWRISHAMNNGPASLSGRNLSFPDEVTNELIDWMTAKPAGGSACLPHRSSATPWSTLAHCAANPADGARCQSDRTRNSTAY